MKNDNAISAGKKQESSFRPLFSEINPLYASSKDNPNTFRFMIRMMDPIDSTLLGHAVETTMARYPYFCVKLHKCGRTWGFLDNPRPIILTHSKECAELNSEASNYHLITFSWESDCIYMGISHALTDGTGAYEVLRTLLYSYCTDRYQTALIRDGIRLVGDDISPEEWEDPAARIIKQPPADGGETPPALDPVKEAGLTTDTHRTVFSVSVSESEFMRFNIEHDGSPGTMAALFLSRAIASVHPDSIHPIRISLCVNQRKALGAPLAHQSLVGGAWLEYKDNIRRYPLTRQATMYRGMVLAQAREESVLEGLTYINRKARELLSKETDEERAAEAWKTRDELKKVLSATVSYVGKAAFGGAEKYIRDFHLWAPAMNENILIEISAVNKRFTLDFIQNFSNPVYWNAFLKQFEENGIAYEQYAAESLVLPGIRLPWIR